MGIAANDVTTIGEAAAEFGLPRETFRRRFNSLNIIPSEKVPRSGTGKGFTDAQMAQLRRALSGRGAVARSA